VIPCPGSDPRIGATSLIRVMVSALGTEQTKMAEISEEEIQVHLSDANTPAPLREAYQALKGQLDSERASRTDLERRAAFAEAGLPDVPQRELIERTYEGEMNAEAIREYAAKYGVVPGATTPIAPDNRTDLDALRRIQQAGAGAPPVAPMDFGDALDRAQSQDEWNAVMANAPVESGVQLAKTYKGYKFIN
jgi:hypothetical protein